MMYHVYLFGVAIKNGRYETTDLCEGMVNVDLLRRFERLQEVDAGQGKEYMATVTYRELPQFFLEEGNVERRVVEDWYATLDPSVVMIVIHRTTRDIYSRRRDKTVLHKYVQLNSASAR